MKIEVETDECGTWVGVKINGCSVTFKEALKRVLDKKSCEVPKCNEPYKICFDGHTIKFSNVSRWAELMEIGLLILISIVRVLKEIMKVQPNICLVKLFNLVFVILSIYPVVFFQIVV